MLPNFICIGAQKSGTTTISRILEAHPQVFMQPMETRFFFDPSQFNEGLQKYEIKYFSAWSGQPAVGEKCPGYLYWPEVADRLYNYLGPDIKLIVALRSPAKRAFSHYRHNLVMLRESRSFEEVLETEAKEIEQGTTSPPYGYIARGYYAQQLQRYFELFDPKQFLIVNFEKVVKDQKKFADQLFNFLGIDSFATGLPFKEGLGGIENLSYRLSLNNANKQDNFVEINKQSSKTNTLLNWLRQLKTGKLSTRDTEISRVYNPSEKLIKFAEDFNHNKPKNLSLTRERELEINNYYFRKDIELLQDIVPFKVDSWLA